MSDDPSINRTRLFSIVFALLVILTAISFAVANSSIMDEPVKGWLAMMVISVAKAMLVIIFFMHLKWETNWKYVLTIPAAVMSCLLVLILIPDIGNRTDQYSEERKKFAAYELSVDEVDSSSHQQQGPEPKEAGNGENVEGAPVKTDVSEKND